MKNRILQVILLFCISLNINAQDIRKTTATISGSVYDLSENTPIEMATISLFNLKDSTLIKGVFANKDGLFQIEKINSASYYLSVSFLGYKPVFINVPEHKFTTNKIDLGKISLDNTSVTLTTIEITAELPELVVKEDTLEYNADAFKMQQGAVAEDLIKRLPGVEVDNDGKITTSSGKQVKRVFVDGKEFFGNDPKMATKNLTTDIIDKIQVVEKKSDLALLTGVEDDDPETIINITIKKGRKQGWMGNVTGGIGALVDNPMDESARYSAGAMINRFGEKDQISFITNANNVNNQASTDYGNTVRSSRGSAGNGIVSSNTFGVNTAKDISKKLKIGGNLSYNYSDSYSKSNSLRENLFNDSSTYRSSNSLDKDYSNNLSFNARLDYHPDSLTTIRFTPTASYNWSSSNSSSFGELREESLSGNLINSNQSANTLKSSGLNLRLQFDISRKLSSLGRRISFSSWYNINNSKGDGTNNSENIFYRNNNKNKTHRQISDNSGDRDSYNLRFTYVEPLGRGNFINFSYNVQVNDTRNEKYTYEYDPLTDDYTLRDTIYNRSSYTKTINHNIRLNFNSTKTKYAYNIGLNISPNHTNNKKYLKDWLVEGEDEYIDSTEPLNRINFAPQLDFTYKLGNKTVRRNLKFRYNGRTTQPSINQLDASITNPSAINKRSGNPELAPSFSNNISLDYNNYDRIQQRSLNASLTYTFTKDDFVNSTTYYDDGTQLTMPVNVNGSWNTFANLLYSQPLDKKKRFKVNTQTSFRFRNQIGFSQVNKSNEKNIAKTVILNGNLGISYSNDWFYGQVRGRISYTQSDYSIADISSKESYNYTATYSTQITLPYNFYIASDINYTGNRGLSSGMNKNEIIWNAQIDKQIFKKKNGSIRLQIQDILQQRLNIRRSVSHDYIQDTEFTSLTSYVMLSFSYRFNNIGGGDGRKRNKDSNRTRMSSF